MRQAGQLFVFQNSRIYFACGALFIQQLPAEKIVAER